MISQTEMLIRILIAAGLGALIGFERERKGQPAGLRTHIVLVVGSTLAMCLSINLAIDFTPGMVLGDPSRLAAQVLTGIGFLCAGAILRFGATVRGLTTAASLWTMAVVGLAVGAGYYLAASGVTALLLIVLSFVNWVESRLMKPVISTQFTLFAIDHPGVEAEVRSIFEKNSSHIEYFRMNRHIRRKRIRIEALLKLQNKEQVEQMNKLLTDIDGVKIIKYE